MYGWSPCSSDVTASCYVGIDSDSWDDAVTKCQQLAYGGYLAIVTSQDEQTIVRDFIVRKNNHKLTRHTHLFALCLTLSRVHVSLKQVWYFYRHYSVFSM